MISSLPILCDGGKSVWRETSEKKKKKMSQSAEKYNTDMFGGAAV
jgi:hypothetical protein